MLSRSGSLITDPTRNLRGWAFALGLLALLSGCAPQFERYDLGGLALWIGPQEAVQHECEARGTVLYSTQHKISGCTDFANRTIVSVPHMAVLAHELCHWIKQTPSTQACPTPLLTDSAQYLKTDQAPGGGS